MHNIKFSVLCSFKSVLSLNNVVQHVYFNEKFDSILNKHWIERNFWEKTFVFRILYIYFDGRFISFVKCKWEENKQKTIVIVSLSTSTDCVSVSF